MPKKVSPEYFIQLSQRVNIVHKGKGKIYQSPSERDKRKLQTRVKDRVTNHLHVY